MKSIFNTRLDRTKKEEKGFTLVELLVVVTIFAILLGITVPNYLNTRPQRLLSAQANRLGQMIRFGRLQAIRDNENYYLEFIPELDMYRLWGKKGWDAYADPGDLNGDLDRDGDDYTDGEDADLYDGIVDDPDILLDPLLPENRPLNTVAPLLRVDLNSDGTLLDISRDLDNPDFVGDQAVFPYDVDLRLLPLSWNPGTSDLFTRPTWTDQVNILSRGPLLFIVFFPDGTVSSSWQFDPPPGLADEIRNLQGGQLGVTEIFLTIRGEYNTRALDMYPDPSGGNFNGSYDPTITLSHWETLPYEKAINDTYGRRILINHATGRIKVENFAPEYLDRDQDDNELMYF